jgi:hypothetical protein
MCCSCKIDQPDSEGRCADPGRFARASGWELLLLWIIILAVGAALCCVYCCAVSTLRGRKTRGGEVHLPAAAGIEMGAIASSSVQVICPPGAAPGSVVQASVNGELVRVIVPPGVGPGGVFAVRC